MTAQDILVIHARLVDATGGSHGVRDADRLSSIAERPKTSFAGEEMYPNVYMKAAALLEGLVRYHVFVDGNKRTALTVATRFLYINGYQFTATNTDAEHFIVRVAEERIDVAAIAEWLERHTQEVATE